MVVGTSANLNDLTWWTEKHNGYATREMADMLMMEYGQRNRDNLYTGIGCTGMDVLTTENVILNPEYLEYRKEKANE